MLTPSTTLLLPSDTPDAVRSFVAFCLDDLDRNGVSVLISGGAQVNTRDDGLGMNCSGYFEDRPLPRLAVATGKPLDEWLPIFAHEYSHFTQWRDHSPVWADIFLLVDGREQEATALIDQWLEGALELDAGRLADIIDRARRVERDCEQRTVALIRQHGLPIDVAEYGQKANAYTEFYTRLAETRTWYPSGGAPYQIEEVWSAAPSEVLPVNDPTPPGLLEALRRHYPSADERALKMR